MFLLNLTYKKSLDDVTACLSAHLEFLDKHYATGQFIFSGRKNPLNGGIILVRGDSLEAIKTLYQQDPFFTSGIADYEIINFTPTKYSDDFAPIIAHDHNTNI